MWYSSGDSRFRNRTTFYMQRKIEATLCGKQKALLTSLLKDYPAEALPHPV